MTREIFARLNKLPAIHKQSHIFGGWSLIKLDVRHSTTDKNMSAFTTKLGEGKQGLSGLGKAVSGGRFGSLQGALDEFHVWDSANSAIKIASTFDVSITSLETGLVNNFSFVNYGEDSVGYLGNDAQGLQFIDGFDFTLWRMPR